MKWYYSDNGQQAGPVSQEEIESRLREGAMGPDNLVWKEGMPEWLPASQVLGAAVTQGFSSPATVVMQNTPMGSAAAAPLAVNPQPTGSGTVNVEIKPANFRKFLTLVILGWLLVFGGSILVGLGDNGTNQTLTAAGAGLIFIGMIPLLWGTILSFIYLYRCWLIVDSGSNGTARATPGKAVGFLFIPFFNLYWVFQAYHGWSQDYNQLAQRNGWQNNVPEGIFLAYAILTVLGAIPLINYLSMLGQLVLVPMTVYHMCNTINYHANA